MFFDTHVVIILSLSVQNEVKYWLAGPDQMSTNVKLESCLLMWLRRAPNLFSAHLIKSNRRNMVVPTVYKKSLSRQVLWGKPGINFLIAEATLGIP